jgi:hypothetical protein
MRGNAAELAGLLELGELDYIFEYESLARSHEFRYLLLPPAVMGVGLCRTVRSQPLMSHPGAAAT